MPITSKPTFFFGHQYTTRKVLTAFMDYFSKRVYIERFAQDGLTYRYIQVPMHYAQRDRFFQILKGVNLQHRGGGPAELELDLNRILPRMSLGLSGIATNSEKRLNKFHKIKKSEFNEDTLTRDFVPAGVPVNLDFELNIITKSSDDTFQIFEQIIPYFGTAFSLDINLLEGFQSESVPFSMGSVSPDTSDEWDVGTDRIFIGTISFTAQVNYYLARVDLNSQEYIRQINTNFHVGDRDSSTFQKFISYQLTADNLSPIDGLDEQPSSTVILTPPFLGPFNEKFSRAFA